MQVQLRLVVSLVVIALPIFTIAPLSAQILLPPPPPRSPSLPPSSPILVNPPPLSPPPPEVAPIPNQAFPRATGRFRVFIESSSPFVLQQARAIQPDAFFQTFEGRRVIQAGLFSDEIKARQQVARFEAQGIPARLTTRSPEVSFAQSGYYAIVPGNQTEVQEYRERAVRLGVTQSLVQLRDRPRGLHLAVGPFPNRREAEQVVQYLRDRGSLDARLFYDK